MTDIQNLQGKDLEQFKSNFKIESYWAPITFTSLVDNQKYAIATGSPWIPIPHSMTQQEVHDRWVKKVFEKPISKISKKVASGRGKGEYTVTFDKAWKCTCSGYKFRGHCSHIDKVKAELKLKLK